MDGNLPAQQQNIALLKQQDANQFEFAKLNLEKTMENNKMWAAHWKTMRRDTYIFMGIILLAILTFCVISINMGQADIAKQIIGGLILFIAGGGSGYALGLKKSNHQNSQ